MGGGAGFSTDFNILGRVVENADSDVIELECLLDFFDDLSQHFFGILVGDCRLGDVVEESQLPGAPLFFRKQPGVLDSYRDLPCRRLHDFQIALIESEFPRAAHRNHNASYMARDKNGRAAERQSGTRGNIGDAEPRSCALQLGTDQQRLPRAQNIFRESVRGFSRAFGHDDAILDFELKANFFAFAKGDIKIARIEKAS